MTRMHIWTSQRSLNGREEGRHFPVTEIMGPAEQGRSKLLEMS